MPKIERTWAIQADDWRGKAGFFFFLEFLMMTGKR